MLNFLKKEEKKVEFIELIYDLVFVYIIGRNNSLLEHITDGRISAEVYVTFTLCTLITIQIWYSSTIFINRYGTNSLSEYVGLFVNMYLLYYMADGARTDWHEYFYRYNVAWMLILLNLMLQYFLKYRKTEKTEILRRVNILQYMVSLGIQVVIILVGIGLYPLTGIPLTPLSMVFGLFSTYVGRERGSKVSLDFPHLTERIMLYIVFTFGEMIIAISSYFTGEINFSGIFYSAMAFLIVVGLFMSYGFLYDHLLNREMEVSGDAYMILHVFIIFSLSNLTAAFGFMREAEMDIVFKNIYLVSSFVVYYIFLFLLAPYTRGYRKGHMRPYWKFGITLSLFIVLMLVFYRNSVVSILISVLLTFVVCLLEYGYRKETEGGSRLT